MWRDLETLFRGDLSVGRLQAFQQARMTLRCRLEQSFMPIDHIREVSERGLEMRDLDFQLLDTRVVGHGDVRC